MAEFLSRREVIALLVCTLASAASQEPEPAPEAGYEFVSGTIAELPPGKIVVQRTVLGKSAERRTFTITSATKVEGNLRLRARVTVGFKSSEEGEPVAVRIIVRDRR